jgi:hypothetical protein
MARRRDKPGDVAAEKGNKMSQKPEQRKFSGNSFKAY